MKSYYRTGFTQLSSPTPKSSIRSLLDVRHCKLGVSTTTCSCLVHVGQCAAGAARCRQCRGSMPQGVGSWRPNWANGSSRTTKSSWRNNVDSASTDQRQTTASWRRLLVETNWRKKVVYWSHTSRSVCAITGVDSLSLSLSVTSPLSYASPSLSFLLHWPRLRSSGVHASTEGYGLCWIKLARFFSVCRKLSRRGFVYVYAPCVASLPTDHTRNSRCAWFYRPPTYTVLWLGNR